MSNVPMTRPEELLAVHERPYFRAASFVELEDGRILSASGADFHTSEDGGITWSDAFENRDVNGGPVTGASLVKLSGNGVGLMGSVRGDDRRLVFWRSEDGGETWQPPVRVTEPHQRVSALHDTMLRTSSGRIVMPVYIMFGTGDDAYVAGTATTGPNDAVSPKPGKLVNGQWVPVSGHFFDPRFSGSAVYYSDDDGRTWQRNKDGELIILLDWNATYTYTNEPSATEVEPGKLLMVLRTGVGRLYQSWSYDGGETWSRPAPTTLAAATTPAQIRTLPNGHLLVVWNQAGESEIRQSYTRTRLSSAISRNGGSVWEFFQNIESLHEETRVEPGPIQRVGPAEYHVEPGLSASERDAADVSTVTSYGKWDYPAVLVLKDRVLVAYSYQDYPEHPTRAQLSGVDTLSGRGFDQKLKVLPLSWFYGRKEPADNPALVRS